MTVTRHGGAEMLLHADRCTTTSVGGVVTCRKGILRDDGTLKPFAEATLDRGYWHITKGVAPLSQSHRHR